MFFAHVYYYQCQDCYKKQIDYSKQKIVSIMDLKETIIKDIEDNQIILYMKGTKDMPMCGFSNSAKF